MQCFTHTDVEAIGSCSNCGRGICNNCSIEFGDKLKCRNCIKISGSSQQIKNPGLAAVLSFFFAGLGQIYNGQLGKGLILMVIDVLNFFLIFILIGFVTGLITKIYAISDAYNTAKRINSGEIKD